MNQTTGGFGLVRTEPLCMASKHTLQSPIDLARPRRKESSLFTALSRAHGEIFLVEIFWLPPEAINPTSHRLTHRNKTFFKPTGTRLQLTICLLTAKGGRCLTRQFLIHRQGACCDWVQHHRGIAAARSPVKRQNFDPFASFKSVHGKT